MAKRNVIWTKTADLQFIGVLEYWVKRNKSNTYSTKLVKLVSERTKQIAIDPLIYKKSDFKDVRVASLGHFSIYYRVYEREIVIISFWDNRQDPRKLLKILESHK